MTATQLRAQLVAAGLTTKEWPGWQTNGSTWKDGKPVGVMQHHTAPPVPFPVGRLAGEDQGRVKCNINTKPDGTVWLIAYRACNYSSGSGSGVVLDEVRRGIAPSGLAKARGLPDTINGNPYFWNFENDHEGDGRSLPAVQAKAILTATRVVNDHFGLKPNQTIAHAEWTGRKIDPRWNGKNAHVSLKEMRVTLGEEDMTPEQTAAVNWLVNALASKFGDPPPWGEANWNRYEKLWTGKPGPHNVFTHIQAAFIWRTLDRRIIAQDTEIAALRKIIEDLAPGSGLTEAQVKALIATTKLTP